MKFFLSAALLFFTHLLWAQNFVESWETTFSATGTVEIVKMIHDADDNVIILANQRQSGGPVYDGLVLKYSKSGVFQWSKSYGYDSETNDYGVDVDVDDNGNIYVLFSIDPENAGNTNPNGFLLRKYSPSGTVVNSYESVGSLGYVPQKVAFYESQNRVYFTASKNQNPGKGLLLGLYRLSDGLVYEYAKNYESDEDDVAFAIDTGSTVTVQFQKGTSEIAALSIPYNFGVSDSFSEAGSIVVTESIDNIAYKQISSYRYFKLELGNGTVDLYERSSSNVTKAVFTGEPGFVGDFSRSSGNVVVTGDFYGNAVRREYDFAGGSYTLEYELDDPQTIGNLITPEGYVLGSVVENNTRYFGALEFDFYGVSDKWYHSSTGGETLDKALADSDGNFIFATSPGSQIKLFTLCNGPVGINLGADINTELETVTLSIGSSPANEANWETIEWSTGQTGVKSIDVSGYREVKNISVTVTNANGCSFTDEIQVTFRVPAPGLPQPEIVGMNGAAPVFRFTWDKTIAEVVEYGIDQKFYIGSCGVFPGDWEEFSSSSSGNANDYIDITTSIHAGLQLFGGYAEDAAENRSYPGYQLALQPCNCYDMEALDTYLATVAINDGNDVVGEGEISSFLIVNPETNTRKTSDQELLSFFQWEVPEGWDIIDYQGTLIKTRINEGAASGSISVKIVNPCTGDQTSAISKQVTVTKDQTIAFDQPADIQMGDDPIALGAMASSGLDVAYDIEPFDILDINNGMITPLYAGTVTVTATQAGNFEWNEANPVQQTFSINKGDDEITFGELDDVFWNAENFDLDDLASTKSGRNISWTEVDNAYVSVSSLGAVVVKKPGAVEITATLTGDDNWNTADPVSQTLTILKTNQHLTLDEFPDKLVTDDDFLWSDFLDISSGLTPSLESDDEGVARVLGSLIEIVGAGTATITATQLGNDNYNAADPVNQTLTINKLSQTISFDPIPEKTTDDPSFELDATASSGLDVEYESSNTAVATIVDNIVAIVGVGTADIVASQPGNGTYESAPDVTRTLTVSEGVTIAFTEGYPQFEYYLNGAYRLLLELTQNGNVYYVVTAEGADEPTPAQIENGQDASGAPAFKSGSAYSLAANNEYNLAQILELEEVTSYEIFLTISDESYALSTVVYQLSVETGDYSKPEWEPGYPVMGTINSLSAEVEIDLNEGDGTVYYAVFASSGATKFPANLKAGSNYGAVDEGSVSASDASFVLTGLSEATAYDVWLVAEDVAENLQTAATKLDFTTIDDIAPEFGAGYPSIATVDETDVEIDVKINEAGTVYAIAQLAGESAPSFAQVQNGQNSSGATAISANSVRVDKNQAAGLALSGLTSQVGYDFYVVAEDDFGNESGAPVNLNATTSDLKAPDISPQTLTLESVDETSATFSFSLDEPGSFYWVVDTDIATSPSPTQVSNGQTEAGAASIHSGSVDVTIADQAYQFEVTGLLADQEYEIYFVAEDENEIPNISESTFSATFSTVDLTAPSFGSTPQITNISAEGFDLQVDVDESGSLFYAVIGASDPLPSTGELSTGSVANVADQGSKSLTAGANDLTVAISLAEESSYQLVLLAADDDENLQNDVVSIDFTVPSSKITQSITFEALEEKTYGDADFDLAAIATSGLGVSYSSSDESVATISGSSVTIVRVGSVTITASQSGNGNYHPAADVEQTLSVSQASQSITFEALEEKTYGDADFDLAAVATSGLGVSYSSSDESVATVSGSSVTIVGVGSVTITASQSGNGNYHPAADVEQTLSVSQASQVITFDEIDDQHFSVGTLSLRATASSGLPVVYALENGDGAINDNVLTFRSAGTFTVTASQPGNGNFNAAEPVSQSFLVNEESVKVPQTITFASIEDQTYGNTIQLSATSSSGLTVNYEVVSGGAVISDGEVKFTGIGTVAIEASQEGDDSYEAAASVSQTFEVLPKTLDVLAEDKRIVYGHPMPELTYTITGFATGEDESALTTAPAVSTEATQDSDAGSYGIFADGAVSDNYVFNYQDGLLVIDKAQAGITITNLEQEADGSAKEPVVTTTPSNLNFTITYDGLADAPIVAGTYEAKVTIDEINYAGEQVAIFTLTESSPLGVEAEALLSVYPNPVADYLTIKNLANKNMAIYDLEGRLQSVDRVGERLDFSGLKPGIYLLKSDGQVLKLIKL
ncbi:MBG domain-containing protein [Imperialibacter roseus]|uniref:MBG domain-containing protein n=1 Tax=Imperialibacter roseus TaxID=1324217 RepID=A0ABZ0J0B3_9BACT|nr:MBG domain-containing protein [Imperialibacter roseus]WOK09382.1 MBG domain-containing protein [Imperialibacter roseus]